MMIGDLEPGKIYEAIVDSGKVPVYALFIGMKKIEPNRHIDVIAFKKDGFVNSLRCYSHYFHNGRLIVSRGKLEPLSSLEIGHLEQRLNKAGL